MEQLVVYFTVDEEPADRLLKKTLGRPKRVGGRKIYDWEEGVATRIGSFLVLAASPEIFDNLASGAFLTASKNYQRVLSRSPEDTTMVAGFHTELLTDSLRLVLTKSEDFESKFLVELFGALGEIAVWFQTQPSGLRGALSLAPTLVPPADGVGVLERSGFADFLGSSVGTDWPPPLSTVPDPYTEIEFSLALPAGMKDPSAQWSSARLVERSAADGHRSEADSNRFVSKTGEPLPAHSSVTLPIENDELQQYLRNEHNLDLHSEEVQALAESLGKDLVDPSDIVRSVVDWTHQNLDYTLISRSPSVQEILATRQADCTEYSQLTIALLRTLGIPARPVNGINLSREAAILHRWVEVYLDQWYEVDSTFGVVQVPAEHLRLPGVHGGFLASMPGSRFRIEAFSNGKTNWIRRLPSTLDLDPKDSIAIAVDQDSILLSMVPDDGPRLSPRFFLSRNQGRDFVEIPGSPDSGQFVQLLGGHNRFFSLSLLEDRLRVHRLTDDEQWAPLKLSADLDVQFEWGPTASGFFAFSNSSEPRLIHLSKDLDRAIEVSLPSGEGQWSLSEDGSVLALSSPDGLKLFPWTNDSWSTPIALEDTANRSVESVRTLSKNPDEGTTFEVAVRDPSAEVGSSYLILVTANKQSKRSIPNDDLQEQTTTGSVLGDLWSVLVELRGVLPQPNWLQRTVRGSPSTPSRPEIPTCPTQQSGR